MPLLKQVIPKDKLAETLHAIPVDQSIRGKHSVYLSKYENTVTKAEKVY